MKSCCCCDTPSNADKPTTGGTAPASELPRAMGLNIPLHAVLHKREEWYTEVTELPISLAESTTPYTRAWLAGNATPGGWGIPFRIEMLYATDAPAGTFTWYGPLHAGELKFPLGPESWDVPMLMPKTADDDGFAPLSETQMEVVAPGAVDRKWVVSENEAGNYRVTLNVNTLEVSFTKME